MKPILLLLLLTGCASRPEIWRDKQGVLHRETVEPIEVSYVKVVEDYNDIPYGCIRLRNIYLSGTAFKNYELKLNTAKMFGTHVLRQYYNGLQDTMGIAFDCKNHRAITSKRMALRRYLKNRAVGELERRTYEKHKIVPVKDSIPVLDYEQYK